MRVIMNSLDKFCNSSGSKVSVEKTRLFCSRNINHTIKSSISSLSGYTLIGDLGKYLGIPLHHQRVNGTSYHFVLDKVHKRLSSWKIRKLSLTGRATLVQSVLSTIPMYYMRSTLLPLSVCDEIDQVSRNFVWGSSRAVRKTALVAWDKVCQSKDKGGIGLRQVRSMNKAMLMKLGWELIQRRDKLWVQILRSKYLCGNNVIPNVDKKHVESNTWRGIRKFWNLVINNIRWRIYDGQVTHFCTDTWMGDSPLFVNARRDISTVELERYVRSYVTNEGDWDWNALNPFLSTGDFMKMAAILPPFGVNRPDEIIWKDGKNNRFTVTSTYHIVQGNHDASTDKIWRSI